MATLADMATVVTTELGLYDDTSVLLAKVGIVEAYVMLWDKYPWSDTHTNVEVTAAIGDIAINYPAGIGRIITVRARSVWLSDEGPESPEAAAPDFRSDSRFIDPVTVTYLVETDPDMIERVGPVKYYEEACDIATGDKYIPLYPIPNKETRLFIVGKAPCPGLTSDTATSIIRNIVVCLIAYATASMLRRQRQYGKADLQYKRA